MAQAIKRIFIYSHAMELGGAEKVLLGLLEAIDPKKYQVDLFLMRHQGELLKDLPQYVNLLPESPRYSCMEIPGREVIRRRQFGVALGRYVGKIQARKICRRRKIPKENAVALEYSHKYTEFFMPPMSGEDYDLAISFLTPHYYVQSKVKAKKKIAWIHTDYSTLAVDRDSELRMWAAYDKIVSISDQVTESFVNLFPELREKVLMLGHFMPVTYIQQLCEAGTAEEMKETGGAIRLLSIGRFCYQKNFDNVPDICRRIVESGVPVKWYLIGYGDDNLIRRKIAEAGMEEQVIILGKRDNPYPYFKACDLYVQPSRYEGKSVCVIEAQILGKPVVITNYPTAASQLVDGEDGIVVPMDNEGCAAGIAALLRDPKKMEKLRRNCEKSDYSGGNSIEKLCGFV